MTQHHRQFDDSKRRVSGRLGRDLKVLYEAPGPVPWQVDRAIREQIHRRLARSRPLIIRLRWAAVATAAAAMIAIGAALHHASVFSNHQSSAVSHQSIAEGRADVDNNGRVDILDAFHLAKHIKVRGPTDTQWDFNGDGRVDRDDVDLVAFAAVRLDKGV